MNTSNNIEIYASIPYTVNMENNSRILQSIRDIVPKDACVTITQHHRTTFYTGRELENASIVVIKHQSNAFKFNSGFLSTGVQKELIYAIQHNKPIVLSYMTSSGENRLYRAKLTFNSNGTYDVEGLPGTVGDIKALIASKSTIAAKSANVVSERKHVKISEQVSATFELSNITARVVDIKHENELNLPLLLL